MKKKIKMCVWYFAIFTNILSIIQYLNKDIVTFYRVNLLFFELYIKFYIFIINFIKELYDKKKKNYIYYKIII